MTRRVGGFTINKQKTVRSQAALDEGAPVLTPEEKQADELMSLLEKKKPKKSLKEYSYQLALDLRYPEDNI